MSSTFKQRVAKLGRVKPLTRDTSGSPERISLETGKQPPDVVRATLSLCQRGFAMGEAKQAVERVLGGDEVLIDLAMVADRDVLSDDLDGCGFIVRYQ